LWYNVVSISYVVCSMSISGKQIKNQIPKMQKLKAINQKDVRKSAEWGRKHDKKSQIIEKNTDLFEKTKPNTGLCPEIRSTKS